MKTGQAKTVLSRRGLHWSIKYKSTSRFASGTVISQSSNAGAEVRPGASIAFVIAKAPPPPPTTAPPPPTTAAPRNCDPVYPDVCLHRGIGDYDCASGSGNGPNYDVVDLLEHWHQHIVNLVVFPRVFTIMSQVTVPTDGE